MGTFAFVVNTIEYFESSRHSCPYSALSSVFGVCLSFFCECDSPALSACFVEFVKDPEILIIM